MIALDTNVLVRLLVQDDEEQSRLAREVAAGITPADPAFVAVVVWVESFWILTRAYDLPAAQVLGAFSDLLDRDEVCSEAPRAVAQAVVGARGGADFADALIDAVATGHGCAEVVSFDRRAQRRLGWIDPAELLG
ncbi:PIN domain-containing protein [Kytococcus sedentarius]|uniref:PIN domain-containing protein n=1 Tax=Kytococcus sedentarius TaxID=1276 RepID=UPI00387A34A0